MVKKCIHLIYYRPKIIAIKPGADAASDVGSDVLNISMLLLIIILAMPDA